jgi:hypothetical protein
MWPLKKDQEYRDSTAVGMLVYGIVLLLADVVATLVGWKIEMMPAVIFLPHLILGHFFWGQGDDVR